MTTGDNNLTDAAPQASADHAAEPEAIPPPAIDPAQEPAADGTIMADVPQAPAVPPHDVVAGEGIPSALPPPPLGRVLGYAILCGLVGILISLRAFAAATLPHILTPDGLNFQAVPEGLPLTRLLDWNPTQIGLLQELRDLNPVLLALGTALLCGFLWARALRVLLPDLHLFRRMPAATVDAPPSSSALDASAVALDGQLLLRLTWQFVLVALPLALLGVLELLVAGRAPKIAPLLTAIWFVAAGIWLRTALRTDGFVVRGLGFSRSSAKPRRHATALPEIGLGAALGLLLFGLQAAAMRLPSQETLGKLHALGNFHQERWYALGFHYLLSVGLVCFGAGMLLLLFAPLHTRPFPRLLPTALAVVCAPLALWLQRPYTAQALAKNWDLTTQVLLTARPYDPHFPTSGMPDGIDAGRQLAQLIGLPHRKTASLPDRRLLLFGKMRTFTALLHGYTEDGLPADPDTVPQVEAFLRRRDYNTGLAWTAFKHIYNVGNVHFDSTLSLRACLDDLERSPHNIVVTRTLRDSLFSVAASPENLAILNEWADEKRFAHPDRASLKLMGDLYMRFGEKEKALEWYTRADMPRSFMAEKRADKPLFHDGQIQGTLLWNGKPLVGAQVGAFPHLQNGLPKDLEGAVRDAEKPLLSPYAFSEIFGPTEPRPYLFRWVSAGAVTDSAGHFTLSHLTEGVYHLICTLPPGVVLQPVEDDRVHVLNAPADINIRYPTLRHPSTIYDQGKIEITFKPAEKK